MATVRPHAMKTDGEISQIGLVINTALYQEKLVHQSTPGFRFPGGPDKGLLDS